MPIFDDDLTAVAGKLSETVDEMRARAVMWQTSKT